MYGVQRSTLVVGLDEETFNEVASVLSAAKFYADYGETAAAALESIAFLPFDAIIIAHPLADMPMADFLAAVRRKDSPCRQAAVVLLARQGTLNEAEEFLGKGANRVLPVEDFAEQLPHVLFRLLEVPPRFAMRATSRLKVQLSWGTTQTICQTENISAHGMLIKTDHTYPIGTQMSFELSMPGDNNPVRGFAVVVRHTMERRERVTGVAVRFSSFDSDDKKRFEGLLARLVK
jgi:DNA-binding NarL/FixJ family response regulator